MFAMPRKKPRTTPITFCLAWLLGLLGSGFPMSALAQQSSLSVPGQPSAGSTLGISQAPTPTILRRSGRRKPASPRGPCSPSQKPLTALLPKTNLGLTVAVSPTFFFYIPQTPIKTAEFVLLDEENGTKVYETTFALSGTPGIVSLSLPTSGTFPGLALGKEYHWYVSMICDPQDRSGDIYVDGWIQRVEPNRSLITQLEKASPRDRVTLYRKNDLWYDTLTMLAQRRRLSPNDRALVAEWTTLLKSVELDEIAQEPLVQP